MEPRMTTIAVSPAVFTKMQEVKAKRFLATGKMPSSKGLIEEAILLLSAKEESAAQ